MTNVNELTQPNNQEIILEEISEEELEGVTGGLGPVGDIVGALGGTVVTVGNLLQVLGGVL
ncbi:hypothetical protein [Nostoc sp.]|uniref:hypothetical protein n=1 Tax=Nostoc sp. TaxID=1180 RepID=UPI002FF8FD11